jgi:phage-related protein
LAVGLKKSADAAIEAEKAQATMTAQLRASNISYRDHAKQIDSVIQSHSKLSGFDDEDLQRSFTNIVRVTGDVDKSLRLTGLAADFARAKHMDVAKAGELVGKVAGGNTGILSRYGIQVDKNATSSEALALLQRKFAGQAEAYGKTTAGALDRSRVASENLGEIVGAKLTPLLAKGANALVGLVDKAGTLAGPFRNASGVIGNAVENIIGWITRFRNRNRRDIDAVVDAMRNLARFAKSVFETVIDVIRPVLPHTKRILEGVVQVIRGLVRARKTLSVGRSKRLGVSLPARLRS